MRPGDTLADALFFFLFAQVLKELLAKLTLGHGICQLPWAPDMVGRLHALTTPPNSQITICDTVWMDDLALMQPVSDAEEALPCLSAIAGALVDSCLKRGLHPSLDRNKSEAILVLKGKGSVRLRRDHLCDVDPTVPVDSAFWPQSRIRVVPQYKHLGGMLHHTGKLRHEIRFRAGQAWTAFQAKKRQVFRLRHVELADKVALFQTLICPVLFFGAGTWPELQSADMRALQTCYIGILRTILGVHFRGDVLRLSEDRVLALTAAPLRRSLPTC